MRADVCVVGAGAAGLTVAHALRGSGLSLVVVDSGPVEDAASRDRGEVAGLPYNGLLHGRARGRGGTTAVWPGQCMRLRPADFEGWPFASDELEPWYDAAELLFGLRPGDAAGADWSAAGVEEPAFDPALLRATLGVFARKRRLAALNVGSARVLAATTVTRVERGRLEIVDQAGRRDEIEAEIIVLAAGTLETTRLLLASGHEHPALGRFFQDHAACRPARVETRSLGALHDLFGMRRRGGRRYSPKVALADRLRLEIGGADCLANLVFEAREGSVVEPALRARRALKERRAPSATDVLALGRGLPQVAVAAARVARGRDPTVRPVGAHVLAILEQLPAPESRLELADEVDPLGVPRLRVDWRLGEAERRSLERFVRALGDEFARLGLPRLAIEPWVEDAERWTEHVFDTFHPAGTTRMGAEGVVDVDCEVRGLPGTYVCSASLFPRSGCANPTLTIVALALRLASRLGRS